MGQQSPNIYIIIVNWNGWRDTIECIQSLAGLSYSNFSVVVVDNGSTDDSVRKIKQQYPDIKIIQNEENEGFAAANNQGIRYALNEGADFVWLLNNDTIVAEAALTALVRRVQESPEIGICGSRLVYYHQRNTIQALAGGRYNKWTGITKGIGHQKPQDTSFDRDEVEEKLQFIAGASMFVSRAFIEEIGLMSEDYFLYFEEIDWAMRARERFTLGYAPKSVVYHKEGASTGGNNLNKGQRSMRADYYQLRNRLRFTCKFFPHYLPSVYLTIIYAIVNRMLRGQWNHIPMIIRLMFNFRTNS